MRSPFSIKKIYLIESTKYKFSNKNDMVCAWRHFKNIFHRPLFIIIFRPEMLKFHPYSILTGDTRVEFVIYCVLKAPIFSFKVKTLCQDPKIWKKYPACFDFYSKQIFLAFSENLNLNFWKSPKQHYWYHCFCTRGYGDWQHAIKVSLLKTALL